MPRKSRQSRLLIAFAIIAIVAAVFHIVNYRSDYRVAGRFGAWTGAYPKPTPNYSQIEEGLWMGGHVDEPPPGTQAVLNVCESQDVYQVEVQKWDAIHDAPPAPSFQWLQRQVAFVESERNAGHVVYVHCFGGISRSGMVVTAYLMRRDKCTFEEALRRVRLKRPAVSPNVAFTPLLMEWEHSVREPDSSAASKSP